MHTALFLVLAAAVLSGSVELHRHHSLLEGSSLGRLAGGCHPGLSTHVEPAPHGQSLDCPGCLSRLRHQGGDLAAKARACVEPLLLYALAELRELPFIAPSLSHPSRGPPPSFV